jgi:hypothetical protein
VCGREGESERELMSSSRMTTLRNVKKHPNLRPRKKSHNFIVKDLYQISDTQQCNKMIIILLIRICKTKKKKLISQGDTETNGRPLRRWSSVVLWPLLHVSHHHSI